MSTPLARARASLEGLSVGDAFGERFFGPPIVEIMIAERALPAPPWRVTDDTWMALSVYEVLARFGGIDPDALASSFATHYDVTRGYGRGMHQLFPMLKLGISWQDAAAQLFGGKGSWGNGASMRVAPIGAYFADDIGAAASHAAESARVTHCHEQGVAGAIAVAVATAVAVHDGDLFKDVLPHIPNGLVRTGIEMARDLAPSTAPRDAAELLGNGSRVAAHDTVPFALWCAARHLDNYQEALWTTVAGLGDRDTTCAIVGGIVAAARNAEDIPQAWLSAREQLPAWAFPD